MSNLKARKRSEIAEEYKWNLEDMFATDELWEKEYSEIMELAKEISKFQGKLAESAKTMLAFFEKSDEIGFHFARLYVYANERYHQDTTVSKYQGYASKADTMSVAVSSSMAFLEPELLAIPEETIAKFMEEEPKLAQYKRAIDEIFRSKEHTLSVAEENLLAAAKSLAIAPDNIFSMFNNADLKFGVIKDEEGNDIQITHGNFIALMESKNREVRKAAFESVYDSYSKMGNTVSTTFTSHLAQDKFYANARKYQDSRAMHLDGGNIPTSVYDNLIETVHKHLPAMYKYVELRKKALGVDELHMYDLYVPLVKDVDKKYPFEESKETVEKALAPMGEEYISILKEGFNNRWIDAFENENKRSGAYSWVAYGTHPYVLLNHSETLDSMFTLAHEMGHAIHSYYSNKTQPITYADYRIFVAEVASTCNEALLGEYLLQNSNDKAEKMAIINQKLEGFRGTIFRQTMFAEFEKIVHAKVDAGESLTMEELNTIYYDLVKLYFGEDMVVDEAIKYEWMRIPHFYTSFYVYQYATGYSAATAFSKKILEEGQPAVDRYVSNFLCGGCSKDPIDLLKDAGVDMSSPEPVDEALKVFEEYLAMFEELMD